MKSNLMTEHHDRVACLDLRAATDQQSLTVADDTTDGCTLGKAQFEHFLACHLRVRLGCELSHIGIGRHKEVDVVDVGIEHHLINVTGSQHFLIDDGTNIEAFGHRNIVEILDHGHSFPHAQSFGRQTSQNICLGIARERHKGLRILNTLLVEQS